MVKIRFLSLKVVVAKAMDFASYFLCLPSGGEFREIQVDSHKCIPKMYFWEIGLQTQPPTGPGREV